MATSIAIATTIIHPTQQLVWWLDYHLSRRIQHVLIYMDDLSERPLFEELVGDRSVTLLDGAQHNPDMTPESRTILRQESNLKHAIPHLIAQSYTWLLHIDMDELLYESGGPEASGWHRPDVGHIQFTNHEAIPIVPTSATDDQQLVNDNPVNPFEICTHFRISRKQSGKPFMAYGNGKAAVRLTSTKVKPNGPHMFKDYVGLSYRPPAYRAMLLHYPNPTFADWVAKYRLYGRFPDNWYGNPYKPNGVKFMLRSRDLVLTAEETGDWRAAREYFREWCYSGEGEMGRAVESGEVVVFRPLEEGEKSGAEGEDEPGDGSEDAKSST